MHWRGPAVLRPSSPSLCFIGYRSTSYAAAADITSLIPPLDIRTPTHTQRHTEAAAAAAAGAGSGAAAAASKQASESIIQRQRLASMAAAEAPSDKPLKLSGFGQASVARATHAHKRHSSSSTVVAGQHSPSPSHKHTQEHTIPGGAQRPASLAALRAEVQQRFGLAAGQPFVVTSLSRVEVTEGNFQVRAGRRRMCSVVGWWVLVCGFGGRLTGPSVPPSCGGGCGGGVCRPPPLTLTLTLQHTHAPTQTVAGGRGPVAAGAQVGGRQARRGTGPCFPSYSVSVSRGLGSGRDWDWGALDRFSGVEKGEPSTDSDTLHTHSPHSTHPPPPTRDRWCRSASRTSRTTAR